MSVPTDRMPDAPTRTRQLWAWIPSLYLAEGLPYVVVMTVSVIMYKGFKISNTDIALYTSWLYLPWVIKPLWSPVVDILGTRRRWIWVTQLVVGALPSWGSASRCASTCCPAGSRTCTNTL